MFKIYNEDCLVTMEKINKAGGKVDIVLTSPPYNIIRPNLDDRGYDVYQDVLTNDEYINWTIDIFNHYDSILKKDGCILYNLSYGTENNELMWLVIANIIQKTNFTVADSIIWKKKTAMPNPMSKNKCTRICEYVIVFCRKSEYKTFDMNKKIKSYRKTGQANYENVYNFIEAKNNDGSCNLNKATYSSELCEQLLSMYAKPKSLVYDSFNGTGTTGVACIRLGLNYIGSELSEEQCKYSIERLNNVSKEVKEVAYV